MAFPGNVRLQLKVIEYITVYYNCLFLKCKRRTKINFSRGVGEPERVSPGKDDWERRLAVRGKTFLKKRFFPLKLPFPKNFSKGREISKKQNNQSVNIRLIRQIRERTDLANALFSGNRFEMVNRLFCQDSAAAGSDD